MQVNESPGSRIIQVQSRSSDNTPDKHAKEAKEDLSKSEIKRALMMMVCLMTFEAEYPEDFYDNLFKSTTMRTMLKQLKGRQLRDLSVEEMC